MKKMISALALLLLLSACSLGTPKVKEAFVDENGDLIHPIGNVVELGDWTLEMTSYTTTDELDALDGDYYYPGDEYIFYLVKMNVTNNSDSDAVFLPLDGIESGIEAILYAPFTEDGYYTVAHEDDLTEKVLDVSVAAQETVSLTIPFHILKSTLDNKVIVEVLFSYDNSESKEGEEAPYVIFQVE